MRRMILSFVCALWTMVAPPPAQGKERKTPKRPETPFTVFVQAEPRGEPAIEEKILRAREEFKLSLDRREDWFFRVEDRGNAEIVVEIKALFVEDENRFERRVSRMGASTHTSEHLLADPRYHLYATAVLFANVVELTGTAKAKGEREAASALVKELDRYVKKNYWQLLERRELWRTCDVPQEELGREWVRREVARRVEALGAKVDHAEWSSETFVLQTGSDEYLFPFPPSGFDDCMRALECQRRIVQQIMSHLELPLGKK